MQNRRAPALLLPSILPALTLLAIPATAQFGGLDDRSFQVYPGAGELGACSRTAVGHLFGELSLDALFLFEETPMIFKNPEVYRSRVDLPVVANDVAVYARYPLEPDWIFAVGPDGLTRWRWDGTAFVNDAPTLPGSVWEGALLIGTADLDGDQEADIFGVDATRLKVLLSRAVPIIWQTTTVVPFNETILGVEPVEWNAIPFQELAIRTTSTLWIVEYTGQVLHSAPLSPGSGLLRVVDIPGALRQAVCLFSDGPMGPNQMLDIHAEDTIHQTIDLGSTGPVAMQIGDLDMDLDTDIVLSHRSGTTLELYGGALEQGLLYFAQNLPQTQINVPGWSSSQLNEALPAIADLDYDLDNDVLFAPVGTDRIDLYTNGTIDESTLMCTVFDGSMTAELQGGAFHLTLTSPDSENGWTDVKVVVWLQPRFDYLMESQPFQATQYLPITGSTVEIDIQTPHQVWFEDIYHVEARLVERVGATVVRQGPGYTAMLGLAEPILALWELEDLPDEGDFHGVTFPVPPQFEYPWAETKTSVRGGLGTPRAGGSQTVGTQNGTRGGGQPPGPGGSPDPEGTPNPIFDGHRVRYAYDELTGTWGGGSGCLPNLPDTQVNLPPLE